MNKSTEKITLGSVNEEIKKSVTNEQVVVVEFSLGENFYGIDMAMVQEVIRSPETFIVVPEVHAAIEGVIRLREKIIPVVNLNKYLQLGNSYAQEDSRIIIVQKDAELCGFWVNKVNQIHHLQDGQMEVPPELVLSGKRYVKGVVKLEKEVIFVLDFVRICEDLMAQENFHQIPMYVSQNSSCEETLTECEAFDNREEVEEKK